MSAISGHGDFVENSVGEERMRNRGLTRRGREKATEGRENVQGDDGPAQGFGSGSERGVGGWVQREAGIGRGKQEPWGIGRWRKGNGTKYAGDRGNWGRTAGNVEGKVDRGGEAGGGAAI